MSILLFPKIKNEDFYDQITDFREKKKHQKNAKKAKKDQNSHFCTFFKNIFTNFLKLQKIA